MDLGIAGKKALVCAASKGLGRACAFSLAREGASVTILARTREIVEKTAQEIAAQTGGKVAALACDITTDEGRAAALAACREPDILVNMITPILLIRAVVDRMIARRFGRIVNITSGVVKAPIPTLGLSNGARAGLTGFVAGLARQTVRHNVTINNLLPGSFQTGRLIVSLRAQDPGKPDSALIAEEAAQNPARRLGDPAEFGDACAFLCSTQAGYITGQNLLLDGGAFPGTL